jgi:hypothetical protein
LDVFSWSLFTRADSADDFDRFDVHAEALAQEAAESARVNKDQLKTSKMQEIQELT